MQAVIKFMAYVYLSLIVSLSWEVKFVPSDIPILQRTSTPLNTVYMRDLWCKICHENITVFYEIFWKMSVTSGRVLLRFLQIHSRLHKIFLLHIKMEGIFNNVYIFPLTVIYFLCWYLTFVILTQTNIFKNPICSITLVITYKFPINDKHKIHTCCEERRFGKQGVRSTHPNSSI